MILVFINTYLVILFNHTTVIPKIVYQYNLHQFVIMILNIHQHMLVILFNYVAVINIVLYIHDN